MRKRILIATLLGGAASAATAHAQNLESPFQRDRNVSVLQRPRPGYEAAGLHLGAFTVFPKLTADAASEDNIFYTATNEQSDTVVSVRPQVDVVSQWSRHQLKLSAQANTYRYQDFSNENNTNYQVTGYGRLDIQRNFYASATAGFAHLVESRSSPSVQNATDPVEYDRANLTGRVSREVNRLRVSGEVRLVDYSYDDSAINGVPLDESYRDRKTIEEEARVDFALSPALALYGVATHNARDYKNPPRTGDVDRQSDGWEAAVGADFEITALARGQVQIGYLSQSYDDPTISDVSGYALRGRVEWFPTQLTTVTLTGERSIDDTGLRNAAGALASRFSAEVDHELLRNLVLTGKIDWAQDEYRGIDRTDRQTSATLGVNYLMNRTVGVFGAYSFQTRNSSGAQRGNEFDANRLQVGVVLQY